MQIHKLQLVTPMLAEQRRFYADVFGLPVRQETPDTLVAQVGRSILSFTQVERPIAGVYHFAITIPENQLPAAKSWLQQRVALFSDHTGKDTFYSEQWHAHMLYFSDPMGNVLELIARHTLNNPSDAAFGSSSLLQISEIGIAADDVDAQVAAIQARAIAPYYCGAGSTSFTAIGDDHGLLIVVARGRIWFPNTGRPAAFVPITLVTGDAAQPTMWRFGD